MIHIIFIPVFFWLINLHRQKNGLMNQENYTHVILQNKQLLMKNWKSILGTGYNVQIRKAPAVENEQQYLDL